MSAPEPTALSLKQRLVMFDDDTTRPFANMLDGEGEETTDIEEAAVIIVEGDADRWHVVYLRDYEPVATN